MEVILAKTITTTTKKTITRSLSFRARRGSLRRATSVVMTRAFLAEGFEVSLLREQRLQISLDLVSWDPA